MNSLTIILFIPVLLVLLFSFSKFQRIDKVKFYLCLSCIWMLTWSLILCDDYFITSVSIAFLFFMFAFIFKSRRSKLIKFSLFVALAISFFITLFIMLSILTQSIEFFKKVSISEFLFCLKWGHSVVAINEEKVGCFGITPLLVGTLVITIVAMLVAVPLGLFSAIYISEYASEKVRYIVNTTLQVLSAIPTVVYGYFSVVFLSSFVKQIASFLV